MNINVDYDDETCKAQISNLINRALVEVDKKEEPNMKLVAILLRAVIAIKRERCE